MKRDHQRGVPGVPQLQEVSSESWSKINNCLVVSILRYSKVFGSEMLGFSPLHPLIDHNFPPKKNWTVVGIPLTSEASAVQWGWLRIFNQDIWKCQPSLMNHQQSSKKRFTANSSEWSWEWRLLVLGFCRMPSMPCDVPRNWKNDPISGTTHALGSSRKLRTSPDVWSSADASLALGPRIPWLKPNTNWRGKCWKVAFCVFQWDPPLISPLVRKCAAYFVQMEREQDQEQQPFKTSSRDPIGVSLFSKCPC